MEKGHYFRIRIIRLELIVVYYYISLKFTVLYKLKA
jgi:hypothetical protein